MRTTLQRKAIELYKHLVKNEFGDYYQSGLSAQIACHMTQLSEADSDYFFTPLKIINADIVESMDMHRSHAAHDSV